jgi:hypothetical protein
MYGQSQKATGKGVVVAVASIEPIANLPLITGRKSGFAENSLVKWLWVAIIGTISP